MREQRVLRHVQTRRVRLGVQGVPHRHQVQQDLRGDVLALAAPVLHAASHVTHDELGGGRGRLVPGATGDAGRRGPHRLRQPRAGADLRPGGDQARAVGRHAQVLPAVAADVREAKGGDRGELRESPLRKEGELDEGILVGTSLYSTYLPKHKTPIVAKRCAKVLVASRPEPRLDHRSRVSKILLASLKS